MGARSELRDVGGREAQVAFVEAHGQTIEDTAVRRAADRYVAAGNRGRTAVGDQRHPRDALEFTPKVTGLETSKGRQLRGPRLTRSGTRIVYTIRFTGKPLTGRSTRLRVPFPCVPAQDPLRARRQRELLAGFAAGIASDGGGRVLSRGILSLVRKRIGQ